MLTGNAARDVQEGGRFVEQAAGVTDAETTRRDDRTDPRKANLAAVRVAGEHQVEVVAPRPRELIGRMGKQNAERVFGGPRRDERCRRRRGAEPREFVAGKQNIRAAHVDRF